LRAALASHAGPATPVAAVDRRGRGTTRP
jgi:hypothetical protein